MEITLSCCICPAVATFEAVGLPDDWEDVQLHDDGCFCPEHAVIEGFRSSQCPGCVETWRDCGLFRGFAYHQMHLTIPELEKIAQGTCPKRINGTIGAQVSGDSCTLSELDVSEKATTEAGAALVAAILNYSRRYHRNKGRR